jgi:hypothetical protein
MDPTVGKTVSKKTVSVEKDSCRPGLKSTFSFFRQDRTDIDKITINNRKNDVFENRIIGGI